MTLLPGTQAQEPPQGVQGWCVVTVPGVRPALFPDAHAAERYAVRLHGTAWPLYAGKRRNERAAGADTTEGES